MKTNLFPRWAGVCAGICLVITTAGAKTQPPPSDSTETKKTVEPKPLSENVKLGLKWLVGHQHENGGWSIASDGPDMNSESRALIETSDVADTCMALLALQRAGNTPTTGEYSKNVARGIDFVCSQIEASDEDSLYITDVRGTKPQQKLGTYIDTFFAAQVLAEMKGLMPDKVSNERLTKASKKVLGKMDRHQKADGTWAGDGWATTLSQTIASKGINRSLAQGLAVNEPMRERAENYGKGKFDPSNKSFDKTDAAGVDLYAAAAALSATQEAENANNGLKKSMEEKLRSAATDNDREDARKQLNKFAETEKQTKDVRAAVVEKLQDSKFLTGFGSNGGEEFLSYLSIGESLVMEGGDAWTKWDKSITENLNHIQAPTGWWGGSHCITGGTFCTAAALLVLMVDRAPMPSGKIETASR